MIPAQNESESIAQVLIDVKALSNKDGSRVFDRVLVTDNASTDLTAHIARSLGAEVVFEPVSGYGAACLKALELVKVPEIVVFIDADASLQIDESIPLLEAIIEGFDLVIGSRPGSLRQSGSMSIPQLFGNKLASILISSIWNVSVTDLGPFRAIRYETLQLLDMQDRRFGWTVEMQVRAIQHGLSTIEVPVHYRKRIGQSKINGTIKGVIGAGVGIISTIFKLAMNPPGLKRHKIGR